ncbi:MAG TPA: ATP-binding cassette domain-containing protein [Chitinophagaceae bacterium]|jgi:putative ABC transport system ATP-binding protein|nr:ATP-binding cassette domain-containing protein [Chitinophagaceae bacterium]
MFIELQHVLPTYFPQSRTETSEIWGRPLRFEPGEPVQVVAPSGSGKTSLMNFLYGLRTDYNGTITYGGKPLRGLGPEDFARYRKDHLSVVFQDLRLFPEQTVAQNIHIKRQLNPYHGPEKVAEMTARLGIGDKMNSLCRTCSYGEQQRVAIIRALMQPFDFLLLDEPFSHLDNRNAQAAMELILEEAAARKAAILFADLERIPFFSANRLYHL